MEISNSEKNLLHKSLLRKKLKTTLKEFTDKERHTWSQEIQERTQTFLNAFIEQEGQGQEQEQEQEEKQENKKQLEGRQLKGQLKEGERHTNNLSLDLAEKKTMIYVSVSPEVETHDWIEQFLTEGCVWVPRCSGHDIEAVQINSMDDLTEGAYGILEPKKGLKPLENLRELDFVLAPGVGFDTFCNRIGRGKGYFDRFFEFFGAEKRPLFIGLAFPSQIVQQIPCFETDQPLDCVVTPAEIFVRKNSTHPFLNRHQC